MCSLSLSHAGLGEKLKAGQRPSKIIAEVSCDDASDSESDEGESMPFVDSVLVKAPILFMWVLVSFGLHVYNKVVIGKDAEHFPAPLLYTSTQFAMEGLIAALCLAISPQLRRNARFGQETDIGIRQYLYQYGITGSTTAFDIGLSNLALVYISIAVLSIIKVDDFISFSFMLSLKIYTMCLRDRCDTVCYCRYH